MHLLNESDRKPGAFRFLLAQSINICLAVTIGKRVVWACCATYSKRQAHSSRYYNKYLRIRMDQPIVMDISNRPTKDGRWTDEEHRKFL
jgi:hypothetical protein